MKRRRLSLTSDRSISHEGEEGLTNHLSGEVKLGDLIWVRLHGSSWWPAQVVDANTVSESIKPSNRSVGEVLVRVYGSYEYSFVDPVKSRTEFEHVLKQNNGSYREIFHKSLERDRLHFNSSSGSEGNESKSKEVKVEAITPRKMKQNLLEDNQAIVASESKNGMLEGLPDIGGRSTRTGQASLADSLKDDVSDDEGIMQRSVKYLVNVETSNQACVSPRRLAAGNVLPTMDKDGFILLDNPEEQVTFKTSAKDGVKNKLGSCSHKFEEEMKSKAVKQNKVQKKLMPNSPSVKEARSSRTPEKDVFSKNCKPSPMTPTSAAPSSGKSQELSGRRVKVMQSLGLVAPSGSPFYRVGRIYPFCD